MSKKITIFLVDDDEIFQMISKVKIGEAYPNGSIISLLSGEEALTHLNSCSKDELPTILFLDVNMSGMSGWEFIANLKKLNIPLFPIYMTSSSINPVDINKAKHETRVTGFLEKPLNLEKVKGLINSTDL